MKHILNNLTEQEKNAIREQHTGGMKVSTDKFNQLLESKLGDVKPILSEQTKSFDPKTFNPGTALIKPKKPEPVVSKKPYSQPTPKGQTISLIQIKIGNYLVDLNMMRKTSQGATFFGKIRDKKEFYEVLFNCGDNRVVLGLYDGPSNVAYESDTVSPEAVKLLNKAAGCNAYVKNQDTSTDDVTLAEQDIQPQTGNVTTGQTDGGKAELIQIMIDKLNNMAKNPKFNASGVAQVVYNNAAHFLNKTDIFNDQTKYGKPFPSKVPFAPQGLSEQTNKSGKLLESKLLMEDEPEPVSSNRKLKAKFAFDSGKANMTPKTRKQMTDELVTILKPMVPTIEQFINSKYELPKIINVNVGTSQTGTPEANAQVARNRKQLFMNILNDALTQLGINSAAREQIVTMQQQTYQPSKFNYSFYDPKMVKDDDTERFGEMTITPIYTSGLSKQGIARTSQLIQSPDVTMTVKRDKDWLDKIKDVIGIGDSDYYTQQVPDEDSIMDAFLNVGSYSDIEELNQEIYNARRMNLGQYLTSKKLNPRVIGFICKILKDVISKRPGKSPYQVDCSGNSIRIEGLGIEK